jgi:hypothetical protein
MSTTTPSASGQTSTTAQAGTTSSTGATTDTNINKPTTASGVDTTSEPLAKPESDQPAGRAVGHDKQAKLLHVANLQMVSSTCSIKAQSGTTSNQ